MQTAPELHFIYPLFYQLQNLSQEIFCHKLHTIFVKMVDIGTVLCVSGHEILVCRIHAGYVFGTRIKQRDTIIVRIVGRLISFIPLATKDIRRASA